MKFLPRLVFAAVVGAIFAGGFWAMGVPWQPGQKLGSAYFVTSIAVVGAFFFAPVKDVDC